MTCTRRTFLGLLAALLPASSSLAEGNGKIARYFWADTLGNQDGLVEKGEMALLEGALRKTGSFYIITRGPEYKFRPFEIWNRALPSEQTLRDVYRHTTPHQKLGILQVGKNGEVLSAYSLTGNIAESMWVPEKKPFINYKLEMARRRETHEEENETAMA